MKVSCPKCNRKQPAQGPDAIYYCPACKMQFDTTDDGGDFSDRDPAARMMREERNRPPIQRRK